MKIIKIIIINNINDNKITISNHSSSINNIIIIAKIFYALLLIKDILEVKCLFNNI